MPNAFLVALALAAGLAALAAYYARRQFVALGQLAVRVDLSADDRAHFQAQARRRLANSALMLALAAMLAGTHLSGMESRIDRQIAEPLPADAPPEEAQARRDFARFYTYYWIVLLLLLLGVIGVAAADLWATRRFALRHLAGLRSAQREAVAATLEQLRARRAAGDDA